MTTINIETARKLLDVVDMGLCSGVGNPTPGEMCVEAAACYALGLPHGDDPGCVSPALRAYKIALNDSAWPSNAARANGLRELAVLQLGSKGVLDEQWYVRRIAEETIRQIVPMALESAAVTMFEPHLSALRAAADRCRNEGSEEAAWAAEEVACAARAAAWAAEEVARAARAAAACAARACAACAAWAACAGAHAACAARAARAGAVAAEDDKPLILSASICVAILREHQPKLPGVALWDELHANRAPNEGSK